MLAPAMDRKDVWDMYGIAASTTEDAEEEMDSGLWIEGIRCVVRSRESGSRWATAISRPGYDGSLAILVRYDRPLLPVALVTLTRRVITNRCAPNDRTRSRIGETSDQRR